MPLKEILVRTYVIIFSKFIGIILYKWGLLK